MSTDAGLAPRWAVDGTELFYLNRTGLRAVVVSTSGTFTLGLPQLLFESINRQVPGIAPTTTCSPMVSGS